MRFYSNENFPFATVNRLRELGHGVLTSLDAGRAGQAIPDEEVLDYAIQEERVLLTLNRRDFIKLHRQSAEHAGIVVCKFDPDYMALAERIHEAVKGYDDLSERLIRVNRE